MADYELYYWSVPFRGQFVRAVLAQAGKSWREAGDAAIATLMAGPVAKMPLPFMGPPLLIDRKADAAIAQMPAILLYLGETLGLLPASPIQRALTLKLVNDANDVIDELTRNGGESLWSVKSWHDFQPRLRKWMSFWEETARRQNLDPEAGFLFGRTEPGIADLATATLWHGMGSRFPPLQQMLDETAPITAALTRRIAALPALQKLDAKAREEYGDAYCGGKIEESLRKVIDK